MLETKDKEIDRLAEHANMRQDGLMCSEKMLETDTKAFLEFYQKIKQHTLEATTNLDKLKKERNAKAAELRGVQD